MKNSLFKRAIAAVATVPLALTQCLGVANAITVDDSALSLNENGSVLTADDSNKNVTLTGKGGLLYINPDEELAKYELQADGTTFIQDSAWNVRAYSILSNIEKRNGTLNMSKVYEEALKKAGKYEEVLRIFINHLGEFTYSIDNDGNITIEGSLSDIVPDFVKGGSKTIGGALNEVAEKYNVPELKTDRELFNDIKIAGKGKLVINAETLQSSNAMSAKFTFIDANGDVWSGASILDYMISALTSIKKNADLTVESYSDRISDMEDAKDIVDKNIDFYINKLMYTANHVDKYMKGNFSFEAENASDALSKLKNRLEKSKATKYNYYQKHKDSIPDSGEDAATRNWAKRVFNAFIKNTKNSIAPYTIGFTLEDLGTEADRVTDINASLSDSQTGYVSATYPDDEFNEVVSYFATAYPEYKVVDSHKEAVLDVDYSNLFTDSEKNAEAALTYVRVVEVEPLETTTTTTSETTSLTTSETTTDTGSGSTDTGTTSETTTDTGSGSTDTGTTSETTTDTGSGSTDTGTTSETTSETTSVTTGGSGIVEAGGVYAVSTASTVDGYYFSHDSRPFDKGHVENSIQIVVVDDEGVAGEPVPVDMSHITFKEVRSGADNPAGAFKGPNSLKAYTIDDFYYEVDVYYDNELLTYEDGTPVNFHVFIGVKGDANFDMLVDATDSSSVLSYYGKRSVVTNEEEVASLRLAPSSCELVNTYAGFDDFAAFLVDVDRDIYSENNWQILKKDRKLDAPDASSILSFYGKHSTGEYANYTDEELWNVAIKGREEQMKAFLG